MKARSIRFKITLWYAAALIILIGVTLGIVRSASSVVLHKTIRSYLIGVVDANVDDISFVKEKPETIADNAIFVEHAGGFIRIDDDFMQNMNEVSAAIYTEDGSMLYGENPLSRITEDIAFSESYVWDMELDGVDYTLYDRKLNLEGAGNGEVWIRGIVPETETVEQLGQIMRIILYVLPVLILLAVLLGYFLAGRMLDPLRRMEEEASKITSGTDLHRRLDIDSNDEIGRLARVFNRMFEQLETSFAKEQQFTSDASHELRTPMSVIMAQCEYTMSKDRSPEEYKEAMDVIYRQSDRMKNMINDMLAYTRVDQRAEQYTLEEVDLSKITEETALQMQQVAKKGIRMITDIDADLHVRGNAMLLSRLLQNLLSNAYQYGKEGGHIILTLKERYGADEDKGLAVLTVADNGIGISREDQEKIFDRFYRADSSRTTQGTGLGLSMVKKIADLHEAEVVLNSNPDKGTEFVITFARFGEETN